MKKTKFSDLSEEKQLEAKSMYMNLYSVTEIADKYNVPRTSLTHYINKSWKVEREMQKADLFAHWSDVKKSQFTRISNAAVDIISKTIESMARRPDGVPANELKAVTALIESLDKITRLDEGKPTEITEEKPFSIEEVKKKLRLDPFSGADVEEVEFKEVIDTMIEEDKELFQELSKKPEEKQ